MCRFRIGDVVTVCENVPPTHASYIGRSVVIEKAMYGGLYKMVGTTILFFENWLDKR